MKINRRILLTGGITGIFGALLYMFATYISVNYDFNVFVMFCASLLSTVFFYILFIYIDEPRSSVTARIGLILSICGFATVFIMTTVQLAVKAGIEYSNSQVQIPGSLEILKNIPGMLRLIDMGIDVAWDFFIGTALIFFAAAMFNRTGLRKGWALFAGLLGLIVIVLNLLTFPYPPETMGFANIDPYVNLYIILLSLRLMIIGRDYYGVQEKYFEDIPVKSA